MAECAQIGVDRFGAVGIMTLCVPHLCAAHVHLSGVIVESLATRQSPPAFRALIHCTRINPFLSLAMELRRQSCWLTGSIVWSSSASPHPPSLQTPCALPLHFSGFLFALTHSHTTIVTMLQSDSRSRSPSISLATEDGVATPSSSGEGRSAAGVDSTTGGNRRSVHGNSRDAIPEESQHTVSKCLWLCCCSPHLLWWTIGRQVQQLRCSWEETLAVRPFQASCKTSTSETMLPDSEVGGDSRPVSNSEHDNRVTQAGNLLQAGHTVRGEIQQ